MSSKTVIEPALDYQNQGKRRDEALSPDGTVEPEWCDLFESIERNGIGCLSAWRSAAARISRERGLAYHPESIDGVPEEGWTLDPIPWIMPLQRVRSEAGISQRSRLFEALLSDIYGPQKTLKEGLFPAEILLSHRGYLRALHNLPPGNGIIGLGLSAFDVAQDSAGQTFVVNDRFDCPFGLGLALENRSVVNQVLPRLFARCGVRRIGQFFTGDWFDNLGRCSPSGSDAPQVVILDASAQGQHSEAGFLANYCGISRVHPSDLTVRDGRVWIKALRGLVPVDVIWKTMPGRDIDSLESENPSARGTAGLFEAIRGGGVAVASHPGAEVLQSSGFYPYLPRICRTLLDEDLLVPPVATWWCGKPQELSHVLENLSSMVVKPAGHHHDFGTRYGSRLSSRELIELRDQIVANPTRFVGQEELLISTVPTSRPSGLVPRGAVLRMFSFKDGARTTKVMPGGLARVSTADGVVISTRSCGESKDVWVRSPREQEPFSISSALSQSRLVTPDIVPSRTGENLFWTGRYAERTDVISRFAARIVDVRIRGFFQNDKFRRQHENILFKCLFKIFDCKGLLKDAKDADARLDLVLRDQGCPVSVPYNLQRFFNATQNAREEWSPASILAITSCYEGWKSTSQDIDQLAHFDSKLKRLQLNLSAFLGLNLDSMTRDEGWALLDAGRRLERTFIVCALLRFQLKTQMEEDMNTVFNESILYFLDSVRTFQSRFHDTPSSELTVRLLLGEEDYPRSVAYLLMRLDKVLRRLPTPGQNAHPSDLLAPWIESMRAFADAMNNGQYERFETIEFLDEMLSFLATLSDTLTVSYFSHAEEHAS